MTREAGNEEIGKTYGRLQVMRKESTGKFCCLCACGTEAIVEISNLRNGNSKSCGCSRQKHGYSSRVMKHPLYMCWSSIKARCYNPNSVSYGSYGGRGLFMYSPWRTNPELFIRWVEKNLGEKPKSASLDRINNDGNYVPGNLRWATCREQARNRRRKNGLPLGVTKTGKRYTVKIHIGTYDTVEEAEKVFGTTERLLRD